MDRGNDRLGAGIEDLVRAPARHRRRPVRAEGANVGAGDKAAAGADQYHRLDRRVGIAALDILDDALGTPGLKALTGGLSTVMTPIPSTFSKRTNPPSAISSPPSSRAPAHRRDYPV